MKCVNCNKDNLEDKKLCSRCLDKIMGENFQLEWDGIQDIDNENDNLIEKAKALAFVIIYLSVYTEKAMFNSDALKIKRWKKRKYKDKLMFEFLFFMIHLVDRLSFEVLGEDKRAVFMDYLIPEVAKSFILDSDDNTQRAGMILSFDMEYNKKQIEYSKYKKIIASKDEGLANTLIYEFSKKTADMVGEKYDLPLMMYVTKVIVKVITILNLKRLL